MVLLTSRRTLGLRSRQIILISSFYIFYTQLYVFNINIKYRHHSFSSSYTKRKPTTPKTYMNSTSFVLKSLSTSDDDSTTQSFEDRVARVSNKIRATNTLDKNSLIIVEGSFSNLRPIGKRHFEEASTSRAATKRARSSSPAIVVLCRRTQKPNFASVVTPTPCTESKELADIFDCFNKEVDKDYRQLIQESDKWYENFRNSLAQQMQKFNSMLQLRRALVLRRIEEIRENRRHLDRLLERFALYLRNIDKAAHMYNQFFDPISHVVNIFLGKIVYSLVSLLFIVHIKSRKHPVGNNRNNYPLNSKPFR